MPADDLPQWFPYAFPFLFAGMWLAATTMLGFMSGWFGLQEWYPDDGGEEPLLRLRGQSGSMGFGVSLGGILTLTAYPSGLGIRIWRLFGPFQKPLKIPWADIEAEPGGRFFSPMIRLRFGRPANGSLKIGSRSWARLVDAVPQVASLVPPTPFVERVSPRSVALRMLLEWVFITTLAGSFFYLTSRLNDAGTPMSLGESFGFPAVVFGIWQFVRFIKGG